jgi:hypothetical protein
MSYVWGGDVASQPRPVFTNVTLGFAKMVN